MPGWSSEARIWRSWRNRRTRSARAPPAPQNLDRDLLVVLVVVPFGQEDRPHSPVPELANDPIGAESVGEGGGLLGMAEAGQDRLSQRVRGQTEIGGGLRGGHQALHGGAQSGITLAADIQERRSLGWFGVEHRVQNRFDDCPALWGDSLHPASGAPLSGAMSCFAVGTRVFR